LRIDHQLFEELVCNRTADMVIVSIRGTKLLYEWLIGMNS